MRLAVIAILACLGVTALDAQGSADATRTMLAARKLK